MGVVKLDVRSSTQTAKMIVFFHKVSEEWKYLSMVITDAKKI